jgi:homoaconitase/3-isopropylmalate dehydratase large subunit
MQSIQHGELMGKNMTQKILERKTTSPVTTGSVIFPRVDAVMTHDVGTAGVSPLFTAVRILVE